MKDDLLLALDRTLLLMRDDISELATDQVLMSALTETSVALVCDEGHLSSHAAQCGYVTAALLMARSGHQVYLMAPDVPMVGHQPPLQPGRLVSSLLEVGRDLLPGVEFIHGRPPHPVDLEVRFGDSRADLNARDIISVGSTAWAAKLSSSHPVLSTTSNWPVGAMVGAALVAGEAFKLSMRKLNGFAKNKDLFAGQFAPADNVSFILAPPSAPRAAGLGIFDVISAGAITNALLFVLSRIPSVTGTSRVIDDDWGDLSNLNRNMLLRRSGIDAAKASNIASLMSGGLSAIPKLLRYKEDTAGILTPLASKVLVGVDHIPARWLVQKANPEWLGIGATTHWSAMASFHSPGQPCAGCLHPIDDPTEGRIPTVSFVSFWAGLMLATKFLRSQAGEVPSLDAQQTYLTAIRPETPWRSAVAFREDCPVQRHPIKRVGISAA